MCFVDLDKVFDRIPRKVFEWATFFNFVYKPLFIPTITDALLLQIPTIFFMLNLLCATNSIKTKIIFSESHFSICIRYKYVDASFHNYSHNKSLRP